MKNTQKVIGDCECASVKQNNYQNERLPWADPHSNHVGVSLEVLPILGHSPNPYQHCHHCFQQLSTITSYFLDTIFLQLKYSCYTSVKKPALILSSEYNCGEYTCGEYTC